MNLLKNRALTLVTALVIAGAGCSGSKGPAGAPGTDGGTATVITGRLTGAGLQVAVKGATVNADKSVAVNFTVKDDAGNPVDLAGMYSTNAVMAPLFSLCQVNVAADGTMLPYSVLTKSTSKTYTTTPVDPATLSLSPTAINPVNYADPKLGGALVENGSGNGDYTYTFPVGGTYQGAGAGRYLNQSVAQATTALTVDPKSTSTYAIWIELARQTNTTNTDDAKGFKAVNVEYDFVPSDPAATIVKRQIAATSGCNKCHRSFRPEGSVAAAFHGGTRVEGNYCAVCHNVERKSTATNSDGVMPAANASIFVHRIHASEEMLLKITTGTQKTGFQGATDCSKTTCTCSVAAPCTPNSFHGISDVTYPQDLRDCDVCHKDATQGAQIKKVANRAVCGSCHDYVVFDPALVGSLPACVNQVTGAEATDAYGNHNQCVHSGAANIDDTSCKGCHVAGGSGFIGDKHVAVAPVDPANCYTMNNAAGCNNNTNAGNLASAGAVPAGAAQITYDVKSISVVAGNPVIVFKLKKNGADVAFNTYALGAELITGFIGSPSVYFAWSVPQDGIAAPADFNATASAYIKDIWKGNKTVKVAVTSGTAGTGYSQPNPVNGGTATTCLDAALCTCTAQLPCTAAASTLVAGTMTGPDAANSNYYTITLNTVVVPASAKMFTGGLGYTYSLSATQPLTQIDLPAYPPTTVNVTTGKVNNVSCTIAAPCVVQTGGLVVPAPNLWKVGTGFTGRRTVVSNDKCNTCHAQLGAAPTFHAGQRNDAPTCAFCHNTKTTSNGWSANASTFIHGIHGANARGSVDFLWHAGCVLPGIQAPNGTCTSDGTNTGAVYAPKTYGPEVTFPGRLNDCEACHVSGSYDFSNADSSAAVPNLLSSTVATGVYAPAPAQSPNVDSTGATNYGYGFIVTNYTGAIADAASTTLVTSPITAACVSCHASAYEKNHMVLNGGSFYDTRAVAKTKGEACLVCHGPTGEWSITDVHK